MGEVKSKLSVIWAVILGTSFFGMGIALGAVVCSLFPPPEVLDNVQNVVGVPPSEATQATESNGQVGNLQLIAQEEQDLVNFLSILSDGFTKPNPVSP